MASAGKKARRRDGTQFTLFGQPLRIFQRANFFVRPFSRYIVTNKITLWSSSYSACAVYTKTIIHLSVGESGGYLPPIR